jgi:hypothetical protein
MGKIIAGTFNGTGAALYLGIGFKPDFVKVRNLEDSNLSRVEWDIHMSRFAELEAGLRLVGSTGADQVAALTVGTGIKLFDGVGALASASTAYLRRDASPDKRDAGTAGMIKRWTLGNATNRTGNWDAECSTTYVGEGSRIAVLQDIDGQVVEAMVNALTSNGEAANEVTLNKAVKSGVIVGLSGMYDYIGGAAGEVIPAGFSIDATTVINVSGEACCFLAGTYDN